MTRLSVGDMAVLARWFEDCRPKLLGMLRRRIDPALAVRLDPEDVLHDAYLEAQRRWPRFAAGTMTPYAWLYRIALDCLWEAWDRETRGRRDLRKELPWPEQSSIELGLNLAAALSTPSEAFARGEVRAQVRRLMDLLGDKDREVLWMRHFDGLTFREAAQALGLTEDAVIQRHVRAVRRFKKLWESLRRPGETDL